MAIDMVIPVKEGASGAWADLEAGVYDAVVSDIEDAGISDMYPADGPRLKFTFTMPGVTDEEGKPVSLFKWCSQKVSAGNKPSNLYKWAEALGVPPTVGQPFAVSQLMDRPCQIVVEVKQRTDGDSRPNITTILPAKGGGKRAPLAQRVGAPAAEAAEVCVVCDGPFTQYTDKGKPVCDAHAAMFQ